MFSSPSRGIKFGGFYAWPALPVLGAPMCHICSSFVSKASRPLSPNFALMVIERDPATR
jgi:hypothetical protein